jgi:hypothetical protein
MYAFANEFVQANGKREWQAIKHLISIVWWIDLGP